MIFYFSVFFFYIFPFVFWDPFPPLRFQNFDAAMQQPFLCPLVLFPDVVQFFFLKKMKKQAKKKKKKKKGGEIKTTARFLVARLSDFETEPQSPPPRARTRRPRRAAS